MDIGSETREIGVAMTLEGQVALVTGASSGIGWATAVGLARAGAAVALTARRVPELQRLAEEITAAGGKALVAAADVANPAQVDAAVQATLQQFGRLDILVNNAGLNTKTRHFRDMSREDWEQVIRVDLDACYYCIQAVLPAMRQQQSGTIVNVSSNAGRQASLLSGVAYSAAKAGVIALNQSINLEEWQHGIRACVVEPGEVDTPIVLSRPTPPTAAHRATMLQSEDVANAIVLVCSLPMRASIEELMIRPRVRA
jgi:NAD(P)-dependent dehydrogenase (short-subunit alcohol dehydrogenase family)